MGETIICLTAKIIKEVKNNLASFAVRLDEKTVQANLTQVLYINNCPTRCNTKQSIYYSASSLYIFRVSTTPIIRSTQNCNYSLRYWS